MEGEECAEECAVASVHAMDQGEDKTKSRGKANAKASIVSTRAKATNWPKAMSKFLLDWYLAKKKEMPPNTKFKKMDHSCCTCVLNDKFDTTFTVDQVHRHFRRFKEIWVIVDRHINESESRWDKTNKMLILSGSTMANLPVSERAILSKPIPFFSQLQGIFSGCPADGALMVNPSTVAQFDDDLDMHDSLNDMAIYADTDTRGPHGANLDKEGDDDCHEVATSSTMPCEVLADISAPSTQPSTSFAESPRTALKPNIKKCKIVSKAKPKRKELTAMLHGDRYMVHMDMLKGAFAGIHENHANTIRMAPPSDPNTPLWNMLKEIPLTPADRLSVGLYLCKPELEVHRNFFMSMGKEYLEAWAHKYLSGGDAGA